MRDPAETLIPGTTVTLTGTGGVNKTTVTDANGFYSFTDLQPGTYTVTETQPNGEPLWLMSVEWVPSRCSGRDGGIPP